MKVFLYGHLKKINDPDSSYFDNKSIDLSLNGKINIIELLQRLKIKEEWIGEVFIDGIVVNKRLEDVFVTKKTERVAIFPLGMHLLCGGQHLKGHGFITKKPGNKINYW
ncbi:MAG: hypothetical protein ACTSR2_06105 [Candidatus Hodarchaeales archaeon]